MMNLQERIRSIADFLQPYQKIWQNEIMLGYPAPLQDYPETWLQALDKVKHKHDLIALERKEVHGIIEEPSLLNFYAEIEALCALDRAPDLPPMPENAFTFLYMIPKKQHEIRKLAPFVNYLYQKTQVSGVVDIGGGIGLLAQTLNNQYGLKVTSVDYDPALQATGKARHEKNARMTEQKVQYQNLKVLPQDKAFNQLLKAHGMSLGLHTCGNLANTQIASTIEAQAPTLINFGCCYHRLAKNSGDQNLSQFCRQLKPRIIQSPYALTLASRAHRKMNEKDYDFKLRVKNYRYMMHFLLHDEYQKPEMVTLGNTSEKLYQGPFSAYAQEQFHRLEIPPHHSAQELDAWYENPERQKLVHQMLLAGLIRNAFGRPLELYLLLDRALLLEEAGYQVQVLEFFEESLSPRNVGLVAWRP